MSGCLPLLILCYILYSVYHSLRVWTLKQSILARTKHDECAFFRLGSMLSYSSGIQTLELALHNLRAVIYWCLILFAT